MFTLEYERRHYVLRARFIGVYSSQDIADLDAALLGLAARHGPAHVIRDFSAFEGVAVPASKIVQRGQRPSIIPGVASIYGVQQTLTGRDPPKVVSTLDEALHELNITDANFEKVEKL
jgi:hypothetical protein